MLDIRKGYTPCEPDLMLIHRALIFLLIKRIKSRNYVPHCICTLSSLFSPLIA